MLRTVLKRVSFFSKYNERFFSKKLINLGILAHIDAGKTTISEDMLFNANEIKVKGNINDQNTQLDFLKQERERGITIKTAYSCFPWKKKTVNLIDTPGHIDFSNELFLSLCVSDKCVIVIDAKESVQIQTINIFRYIKEHIPIYFFLNKMDIYETDLEYNLKSLKNNLSKKAVLVTIPLYIKKKLKYILDLPSMMLYYYPPIKYGQKKTFKIIPFQQIVHPDKRNQLKNHYALFEPCKEQEQEQEREREREREREKEQGQGHESLVDNQQKQKLEQQKKFIDDDTIYCNEMINNILKKREQLIEVLCDVDNKIEYKYINNIPITYDELKKGLCLNIKEKNIFPVFSGSALNSLGVNLLLDYVTEEEAEEEKNEIKIKKEIETKEKKINSLQKELSFFSKEQNDNRENDKYYKTVLFIFKLVNEKNGFNTFCKVLKGTLKKDTKLLNLRNNKFEQIKSIYKVKADRYIIAKELKQNDIGMIRGMEEVLVCDILCEGIEVETINQINHKINKKVNGEIKTSNIVPMKQIYEFMKEIIHNKEFWYFLKNYKKRMSKNVIVCKCAVEPIDMKKEKELKNAINQICLEDNSIQIYMDKSNRLIIGSIGILNIEVVLDKIKTEYKIHLKTSEVETIRKEYIMGSYENEIKKQMKLNSKYSNIIVGINIKEKQFPDIINYVQNILKYETVSQLLNSKKKKKDTFIEDNIIDISMDENNFHLERKNSNNYSNNNSQTNMIQNNVINITSFKKNDEETMNCKKKGSLKQNFHSSDQRYSKQEVEPSMIIETKRTMKIKKTGNEFEKEEEEEDEDEDEGEEEEESIYEYLLSLNYEKLFQSDIVIDPNVKKYIEELKKINPQKKKLYDDIINSCVTSLKNCLSNGYRTNENIINTEIKITKLKIYDNSTSAVAKYACNDLYYKMLKTLNIQMAQPIALIQIQTNESYVGIIVKDLIQNRKGNIIQIIKNTQNCDFQIINIFAIIPVEYTHNYASALRSISSGHADFCMTCCGYKQE